MTTTTSIHAAIKAALTAAGVAAYDGPADSLPLSGGRVAQCAVLWPSPRLNAYTRAVGGRSGGLDRVTVLCVGATTFDALAVADKVDAALGGLRLSDKGGLLRQVADSERPEAEPNTDPVRVSFAVQYEAVTKGDLTDAES